MKLAVKFIHFLLLSGSRADLGENSDLNEIEDAAVYDKRIPSADFLYNKRIPRAEFAYGKRLPSRDLLYEKRLPSR